MAELVFVFSDMIPLINMIKRGGERAAKIAIVFPFKLMIDVEKVFLRDYKKDFQQKSTYLGREE